MARRAAALAATLVAAPALLPVAQGAAVVPVAPSTPEPPGCVWPNCTSTCDECHSVPFTTCILPVPFIDPCGENAHCSSRLCSCEEGYCHYANSQGCVPKVCGGHTAPVDYVPTDWTRIFAALGPPVPRSAAVQDWVNFAMGSVHLPAAIFLLGIVIASLVCIFVSGVEEHKELDCLPSTPWLLIGLSVGAFLIVLFGIAMRHLSMVHVFEIARGQLRDLHSDIKEVAVHSEVLNDTATNWSQAFFALPSSCDSIYEYAMNALVNKAGGYTNEAVAKINKVHRMVTNMERKVSRAEDFSAIFETVLLAVPVFPVVCMFLVTVAIVTVTLVSWCHHDPKVADKADDVFFLYGGCCITMLIVTTALLAALYLWTGIAEGALCLDVDESIIAIIDDINFSAVGHVTEATDEMMDHTFQHYIVGRGGNPLIAKIDGIRYQLNGMEGVWNTTEPVMDAAKDVCSAFQLFDVHATLNQVRSTLHLMHELLHAKTIWPFYQAIMHTLVCDHLIESQGYLIGINVLMGLVLFPVLAVIAHADLDRWSHWKAKNGRGSRGRGQRPARGFLNKGKVRRREGKEQRSLLKDVSMSDQQGPYPPLEFGAKDFGQPMPQMQPMSPYHWQQQGGAYAPLPLQPGYGSPMGPGYGYAMGPPAGNPMGPSARNLHMQPGPSLQMQPGPAPTWFPEEVVANQPFPSPKAGWSHMGAVSGMNVQVV